MGPSGRVDRGCVNSCGLLKIGELTLQLGTIPVLFMRQKDAAALIHAVSFDEERTS